jgi:hypothetical protein
MYLTSSILLTWTYIVCHNATSYALLVPSSPSPLASAFSQRDDSPSKPIVQQQYFAVQPPLPILEIAYNHIIGQIGENATTAGNVSINNDQHHPGFTRITGLRNKDAPAQCSPTKPCADGSCCNSVSLFVTIDTQH